MHHRWLLTLLALPLAGCDLFNQGKDIFEGLTNPLVGFGVVVGVEAPESELIDLEAAGYSEGTGMTGFLADASNVNDLENAPISGATFRVDAVAAQEQEAGVYLIEPGGDLTYTPNEDWSIDILATTDSELSTAILALPPGADMNLPESHTAGEDITLDFTGLGYDSALVVVFEASSGNVTFSNEPKDIRQVYDFTHGNDELSTLVIPGATAFPGEAFYAVGVAPMVHTTDADLENMNTALSKFLGGKMNFYPVSTLPSR